VQCMSKAIHQRYFADDVSALQAAHMAIARTLHALVGRMRIAEEGLQVGRSLSHESTVGRTEEY
jgi:hypothetical protein